MEEQTKKISIGFGIVYPHLKEQLKELNLPQEQIEEWEAIRSFLIRNSIARVITEKQETKLFQALFNEIMSDIKKVTKDEQTN